MQRATHTSADLGVSVDNKISRLVSLCDSTSVLCRYLIRVFRITMIRRVYLFGLLISFVSSAGGSLSFSLLLHFVLPICQGLFFSAASVSQWLRVPLSFRGGEANIDRLKKTFPQSLVCVTQSITALCFCKLYTD